MHMSHPRDRSCRSRRARFEILVTLWAVLGCGAAACSDDSSSEVQGDAGSGSPEAGESPFNAQTDGGAPAVGSERDGATSSTVDGGGGMGVSNGPYMGAVSLTLPGDLQMTYTAVLSQLDNTADSRLQKGFESEGSVTPSAYDGSVFIPGGPTPKITKYAAGVDGKLTQTGEIGFLAQGITRVYKAPVIGVDMVSAEKAYYYDESTLQIIIWNPSSMETVGKIDVGLLREGMDAKWTARAFLNYGEGFARKRGKLLFIPVRWQNPDDGMNFFLPIAGLLVIDTERDAVVHLLKDERIADSIYTVLSDSGDLYLFTGAIGVAQNRVYHNAKRGGAIRVRKDEDTFDPNFYVDLEAAVGNRIATTPVLAGGNSVYVRVYDEERQPITGELSNDPYLLLTQQAWRYWKVDLTGVGPAQLIDALPWTSTDGYVYEIPQEGRLFLGVMAADFSNTTLYERTNAGFSMATMVKGALSSVMRLDRKQ